MGKMQVSQYQDGFLPQLFNQATRATAARGRLRIVIAPVLRGRYSELRSRFQSCLPVLGTTLLCTARVGSEQL